MVHFVDLYIVTVILFDDFSFFRVVICVKWAEAKQKERSQPLLPQKIKFQTMNKNQFNLSGKVEGLKNPLRKNPIW